MSNAFRCSPRRAPLQRSAARDVNRLSSLKRSQIVSHVWISRRQGVDIAEFDVDFLYPGPFCARADDACSVEHITRDQELHALAGAEIRTDYGMLACSIFVQQKNFNRIVEITVAKLIVANAMESHGCIRRHMKYNAEPAGRPSRNGAGSPPGAIR